MTLDDVLFTMKIAYISRATLDSEGHWTPLDLGTGSIVWAPKRLRGYGGEQSSACPPATRHRRALTKWGPSMHEFSGSLTSSPLSITHSSTAKAAPTASTICPARFPDPATEYDRNGLTNFNLVWVDKPQPRWRKRYLPPTDPRAARSLFADPRGRFGWTRAPRRKHCLGWARALYRKHCFGWTRTPRRKHCLGWARAPHCTCCLGWAPSHLYRISRVSHTRATYKD